MTARADALRPALAWLQRVSGREQTPGPVRFAAKALWLSVLAAAGSPKAAASGSGGAVSLARFWRWQVDRRRNVGMAIDLVLPGGTPLLVPAWSQIGGMIVANGSHEVAETAFLRDALAADDVFVDVGANIGFYSALALDALAAVVAFEPDPRAGSVLSRNLARIGPSDRFEVHQCAAGDRDGEVGFTRGLEVCNHITDVVGDNVVKVALRRIDSVATASPILRSVQGSVRGCCWLKVDAEGHDLEGATELIGRVRPVLIVEAWDGGGEVVDLLGPMGYAFYEYSAQRRSLSAFALGDRRGRGPVNVLAIPGDRLDEIVRRLGGAARGRAGGRPQIRGWVADG